MGQGRPEREREKEREKSLGNCGMEVPGEGSGVGSRKEPVGRGSTVGGNGGVSEMGMEGQQSRGPQWSRGLGWGAAG